MAAQKKAPQPTSPNDESDTKKDESSILTSKQEEPNEEKQPVLLRNVRHVELMLPTSILNLSSRVSVSITQGVIMWEDPNGRGVSVVSSDERVKGCDIIPWANLRKVSYA